MAAYTPSAQLKLTNVAYVRLQKKGKRFEIACYRNKVLSWRNKMETDITEVLQIDTVFINVSKGLLANSKDLQEAFGTSDQIAVCHEILDKGELQVSEKERAALFDSVQRDIAAIVADKSINPENNRPYTISMIQNAMRQIHYSISINKSAKSQALEVIRKLKDVMPIARASMLLKVICPLKVRDEMKRAIEEEMGLVILKEVEVSVASSTEGDNSKGYIHYDIRIDPEIFRKLEESIQTITQGLGRLDVLLFRDSTPAVVNPKLKAQPVIENNDTDNKNIAEKPDTEKPKRKSRKKKVIEVEEDTPAVSKAPKFQLLDDDSDDDESDAWEEVHIEAENDHIEEVTKTLDDSDINNEEERNVPKSGGDDSDEYLSDSDEDAIGMVKSKGQTKKKKNKKVKDATNADVEKGLESLTVSRDTSQATSIDNSTAASKKSKKAKRMDKEEQKEKQKKMDTLRSRIEEDRARSQPTESRVSQLLKPNVSESGSSSTENTTKSSLSCNTCSGTFPDSTAYRNHFKSEWHRHNLKRKMKNLPIIASEEEFAALPVEEIEI